MKDDKNYSYKKSGVDIDKAEDIKKEFALSMSINSDPRILNGVGDFASLFAANFPGIEDPVLVMKMEEPGSKQLLASKHGQLPLIAYDLVNHLINDIIVMGATPLVVMDNIVTGYIDKTIVSEYVKHLSIACREQWCSLIGGETSEQPGVVPNGTYILSASIIGVVDKIKRITGDTIEKGDDIICLDSNGLMTNGYSLVRKLLDTITDFRPSIKQLLEPHPCFYRAIRDIFDLTHGIAHITGGGIRNNLRRILPAGLGAKIDLALLNHDPIFTQIKKAGNITDEDMLNTFNLGAGMLLVVSPDHTTKVLKHIDKKFYSGRKVGTITKSKQGNIKFINKIEWYQGV